MPEWLKGTDCKSVAVGYDGSNPSLPTIFFLALKLSEKTFKKYFKKCLTKGWKKGIINKLTHESTKTKVLERSEKAVFLEN